MLWFPISYANFAHENLSFVRRETWHGFARPNCQSTWGFRNLEPLLQHNLSINRLQRLTKLYKKNHWISSPMFLALAMASSKAPQLWLESHCVFMITKEVVFPRCDSRASSQSIYTISWLRLYTWYDERLGLLGLKRRAVTVRNKVGKCSHSMPCCLPLLFWLKGQSAVLAVNAVTRLHFERQCIPLEALNTFQEVPRL